MIFTHLLLALFWILFGVLHSVLASNKIKDAIRRSQKQWYKHYRIYYTLFAFTSFAAVLYYQITMESFDLFQRSAISRAAGIVIGLVGLVIMAICIRKYFFSLSGLKALVTDQPSNELIITGIHKHMRHPLYLGTFLFIWGLFIYIPYCSLLIANLVITIYTLYGISLEEAKLEEEFGDQYRQYKATVPKLIPFI